MIDNSLVLGPLLRFVDETSASIWVEAKSASQVSVHAVGGTWTTGTFSVHGHHYALVEVDGLEPGCIAEYTVDIDGTEVWPPADSEFPPSRIATLVPGDKLRMAFGSCRTSISHDRAGNRKHGVDAMRAYALHMMSSDDKWPDLILFLGDQVYADETSQPMREFIEARRDPDQPPGEELKDYQEYAHLYFLAWTDPANRWLLSTLPSAMIFDDHDIRDDWNTSEAWREQMNATSWWRGRIVAGLASYWVYQHLGNLSPADRASDEIWKQVVAARDAGGDADLGQVLDDFAGRVDEAPDTYRWSYARDIANSRVIVVDSRAARVLKPENRAILDGEAMDWLDAQLQGDHDHVFIGTSLPFLLSRGLHELEAWDEAVAMGAWGRRAKSVGERIRQGVDLEHWAAFQDSFRKVAAMVCELADGKRGKAPATVTFLSGDVHNSYVAEVQRDGECRILQAVCSPIRNPLPYAIRYATAFSSKNTGRGIGRLLARSAKVPDPPFWWHTIKGPWFDNNLATLECHGRDVSMWWERGVVEEGRDDDPGLEVVSEMHIKG